jgi:hypothetical protein
MNFLFGINPVASALAVHTTDSLFYQKEYLKLHSHHTSSSGGSFFYVSDSTRSGFHLLIYYSGLMRVATKKYT